MLLLTKNKPSQYLHSGVKVHIKLLHFMNILKSPCMIYIINKGLQVLKQISKLATFFGAILNKNICF